MLKSKLSSILISATDWYLFKKFKKTALLSSPNFKYPTFLSLKFLNGRFWFSFFTNVIASDAILSKSAKSASSFISLTIFVFSTGLSLFKPTIYLAINIFFTDSSSLSSGIFFLEIALLICLTLLAKSVGINNTSFPAFIALTSGYSFLAKSTIPFISSASVIINPSNSRSSFNKSVMIFFDNVDGTPSSKLGIFKWAVIIEATLLLINFLNG